MPTLLHVDASPRGDQSVSRQLSSAAVGAWKEKNPNGKVIKRDLTKTEMTFVDLNWILGSFSTPDQQTDVHKKALAISDELVGELLEADQIILGTPMYNFAVPAVLKAWIDHIVRAGKTFKYGSTGPEGLAKGRKALIAIASAGNYDASSGMEGLNFEAPYLRFIFGFMGITDVALVQAGNTMRVAQGQISPEEFFPPLLEQVKAAI